MVELKLTSVQVRDLISSRAIAPKISVIIPAHNAGSCIEQCVLKIEKLVIKAHELIVVDDGSTDGSLDILRERGVTVLKTNGRHGPAYARNLGARAATGDVLLFVDSDACLHEDATERVLSALADPAVDAVIGSYDDDPTDRDFLSQYKNLMHHFVHQSSRREASTFWSGCGAIRRQVFLDISGFDESYARPAIEDIELGYRLLRARKKIVLDRRLQVRHLKRWTFWGLIKTDVLDRGIPWTELILRDHNMPADLNLQISQRVSVGLVYLLLAFGFICAIYWKGYFLVPLFVILFAMLSRYWAEGAESSRSVSAVMIGSATVLVALSWSLHMLVLIPLVLASVPLLFLHHRYLKDGRGRLWNHIGITVYILSSLVASLFYLSGHFLTFAIVAVAVVLAALNNRFYMFLAAKRGRTFALAAIPFHLLYHFYNGVSFLTGACIWAIRPYMYRLAREKHQVRDGATARHSDLPHG